MTVLLGFNFPSLYYLSGYVKVYIILPSTIYGIATGELVERGIQNPHSQQVPMLIRAALGRSRAGMIGQGKNFWPNVNIDEGKDKIYSSRTGWLIHYSVADLYIVLYDSIVANPATGHGREGFYFGVNGEHTLYDVGKAIGEALVAIGKADDPEPTTFTEEDIAKYFRVSDHPKFITRASLTEMLRARRFLGQTPVLWRIDRDPLGGSPSRRLRISLRASSRRLLRSFRNMGRHNE